MIKCINCVSGVAQSSSCHQKQTRLNKSRLERDRSTLHTLDKSSTRVTKRKKRCNSCPANITERPTACSYQESCIASTPLPNKEPSASSNEIFASKDFLNLDSLHNLQKNISDMRDRVKILNESIDSLKESLRTEEDCATANDSITSTRSANDSDVHMKTLSDIAELDADNYNEYTETIAGNISISTVTQTIHNEPANSCILDFDSSPHTFANAQDNTTLTNVQHTIPNADDTTQHPNNNNPNMISNNIIHDCPRNDLNPTFSQLHPQQNSNYTFYAQNYVNTRGNNNTACNIIPCIVPPICAPRVNTSCITAVENCINQLEDCIYQGPKSIPTESSNNSNSTKDYQQSNALNIFGKPNLNSSATVVRIQLSRLQDAVRNKICNAFGNQQSNDGRQNIQAKTDTGKETDNTITLTSNCIANSTDTTDSAFNLGPNNSYKEVSRRSSTDSDALIINEDPINSTDTMSQHIIETQDLIKIWDDMSPGKKSVILKFAMSKPQNETLSNVNTALNSVNNTQNERNLQSQSNLKCPVKLGSQSSLQTQTSSDIQFYLASQSDLESQSDMEPQPYLKTQSKLESQTILEPSTNSSTIPEINFKDRPGSLLLEALKVKEITNTNGKDCHKINTTPWITRWRIKDSCRNFKESNDPLTDLTSKYNSTNKESKTSAIVVKSSDKVESKSSTKTSAQRRESTPITDYISNQKSTGTSPIFEEGNTDKSSKDNLKQKKRTTSKHRSKSRSSKRKVPDDDQNGKEKPDNFKRMDVEFKEIYKRHNFNSNSNTASAYYVSSNKYQERPSNKHNNDYDWAYDSESYNYRHSDDVRRCNLDITYSQVSHNYKIPDWPYDTTTNFRRNKVAYRESSKETHTNKSNTPEQKESVPDTKLPSSLRDTGKPNVSKTSNKTGPKANKSKSKHIKQSKKNLGQTLKNQPPPNKTSHSTSSKKNVPKPENNIEKSENSATGKKSPVYVFRSTLHNVFHTESPASPDQETVELVDWFNLT